MARSASRTRSFIVCSACVLAGSLALAGDTSSDPVYAYGAGFGGTIPDNTDPVGFVSPITIDESFTVSSIAVRIDGLAHNYSGDLEIYLSKPGFTSVPVTLLNNLRNGEDADFNGTYRFADDGDDLWAAAANFTGTEDLPEGTYRPIRANNQPSSLDDVFVGTDAQGVWVLRIVDADSFVQGSFEGWSIELGGGPDPASACRGDFNDDGQVDGADFGAFGAEFGRTDCNG
jgi:subtilisin-like proprotein convertase family protein